jgi:hypothetical protein
LKSRAFFGINCTPQTLPSRGHRNHLARVASIGTHLSVAMRKDCERHSTEYDNVGESLIPCDHLAIMF